MPAPPLSRSRVADWDRRTFTGLLAGIAVVGLALQAFLVVEVTTWTSELERVVALAPIVVGVLAYVRTRPTAAVWEIAAISVWGFIAIQIADVTVFVAGPALLGDVSVSAALLSGAAELRLRELLAFLGTVAVFAGFYTAASRRESRAVRAIALLAVPVALVAVYTVL